MTQTNQKKNFMVEEFKVPPLLLFHVPLLGSCNQSVGFLGQKWDVEGKQWTDPIHCGESLHKEILWAPWAVLPIRLCLKKKNQM